MLHWSDFFFFLTSHYWKVQLQLRNVFRRRQTHVVGCLYVARQALLLFAQVLAQGKLKGAALGLQQQSKAGLCLHREGRSFNDESKIRKQRKRGSCTTPQGGNVTMGVGVCRVFTPSAPHLLTLARTFSNEAGLTSEKQMRKTSWWKRQKTAVRK